MTAPLRLILILMVAAAVPARSATLTGSFAAGKAPYFWTEDGEPKGIELDIVAAVLRRAGYELRPRAMPNNRVTATFPDSEIDFATGLQAGDIEGHCHTAVYMAYHNIAISKRERHVILDGADSLLRYRVAIRQALYQDLTLDGRGGPTPPNFKEFISQDQQVRFFFADRADVIILDRLIFHWYAETLGLLPADESVLEVHDLFPAPHGVHAVFKDPDKCARFDRALEAIVADGTYGAIWRSYGIKGVVGPLR